MDQRFILSLLGILSGFVFGVLGIYLIRKQKFVRNPSTGSIEIELPIFGRIKTNYPSIACVFLGAFLIFYSLYSCPPIPPKPLKMSISGKIIKEGRSSHEGIMVGIIPGAWQTFTDCNGNYEMQVLRGETSYTEVAFHRNGNRKDYYLSGVPIDLETNKGNFSYVFGR